MVEENDYFVPNLDFCKGCGICARECPAHAIDMVAEEVEVKLPRSRLSVRGLFESAKQIRFAGV